MPIMNGPPKRATRHPRAKMASITLAGVLAAVGIATLSAEPAGAISSSFAGCTRSAHGRVLSTTPLVRLSSTEVAAEFRDVGLPETARYAIETYRLVYCTVSTSGAPTTASGLLALPQAKAGPLPLVLYDHSTATGKTDAPSFLTETEGRIIPFFFASDGFAVVAPDYLGLGTSPGGHPYLHADSEASASLDMLRAAEVVSGQQGVRMSHNVLVSGFSQGGQAAMATGRALQHAHGSWRLAALAPMAGPYDLSGTESAAGLDPTRTNPQHASFYWAYIFVAWKNLYHLYSNPHQIFTAQYADIVEGLFDGTHGIAEIDAALPAPQELFRPEILTLIANPTGRYAAALRDNDVCHWAPTVPTRLYAAHGDRDVVFANAEQCRRQIMARGGTAQIMDMGDVDHVATAITSLPLIRAWFCQLTTTR
jgi:alpha/beta superfamily hydrolase